MLFPSLTFLFYFLPLFFLGYCLAPGIAAKNVFLLCASLVFYAWGVPRPGAYVTRFCRFPTRL